MMKMENMRETEKRNRGSALKGHVERRASTCERVFIAAVCSRCRARILSSMVRTSASASSAPPSPSPALNPPMPSLLPAPSLALSLRMASTEDETRKTGINVTHSPSMGSNGEKGMIKGSFGQSGNKMEKISTNGSEVRNDTQTEKGQHTTLARKKKRK